MLFGWETESRGFGFHANHSKMPHFEYHGEAPACILANTGAGKGRDFIIPNILTHKGSLVLTDPKGELFATTSRRRRELGQQVIALDPWQVMLKYGGALNFFDLFKLKGSFLESDSEMLASMLSTGHQFQSDPFWTDTATGIISGLIAHIASTEENPTISHLRSYLYHDDLDYKLAVILDEKKFRTQLAHDEFVAYLNHPTDKTRPCVHSTAVTYCKALGSPEVARCLESSSIDLADVVAGEPFTIYIIIPPDKLNSHKALLRVWIATLMTAVMRRKVIPEQKTLFILDEAAQLGTFEPLLTATTLLRSYGLQLVSIWQTLAQLKSRYPLDWQTILDNCGVIETFGISHYGTAKEMGDFIGMSPQELMSMSPDEAAISVRGQGTRVIRRVNYLRDRQFAGLFDRNPYYLGKSPSR
jgi:type IV secretion system protein VirD4